MREHMGLYRGKQRESGAWVEGWLVVNRAAIEPEEPEMTFCYILAYGNNSYVTWYPVDPDTVGECTGLRDKNGKLIFEGDVISIRFESDYEPPSAPDVWYENARIVFSDKYHAWHAVFGDGYECSLWEYDNCDDVFVIGNVTDNPELLKGGEGDG